jgi:8-oxo-dGTP diphosphatase
MTKATVTAVITSGSRTENAVLLTMRNVPPFEGFWCLPGGHIDAYETAEHAVEREVLEETGLAFQASGFLGYFDEIFPECHFHAVVLAFFGTGTGQLRACPGEVREIAWISLREAIAMPLAFNHNKVLQHYASLLES